MANRVIRREEVVGAFRPLAPVLDSIIATAREKSAFAAVAQSNAAVARPSHLHRLCGNIRWMLVADGIVARSAEMGESFSVLTTDADHNAGKYVFGFKLGVFTVKKQPHEEDEGAYLQERLEDVLEQAPLAEGIDAFAALKAYLSVPAKMPARFIVTHKALDTPMILPLGEVLLADTPAPMRLDSGTAPTPVVRSSRQIEEETTQTDVPS